MGTVIGPFQQGISRTTWKRAKGAQNDSKSHQKSSTRKSAEILRRCIRNRDESLMNRAGATRLYGDVTVRNFARHSVGLSWSPEKQSIKSWLEDMDDMIMRTADQCRKTSRIWIKKAKQHCCYLFSSLLSLYLSSLNWLCPIQLQLRWEVQVQGRQLHIVYQFSCLYTAHAQEDTWTSMKIQGSNLDWTSPTVPCLFSNHKRGWSQRINRLTDYVTCPWIFHIPVRQPILMCCLAWDWKMMKLWSIYYTWYPPKVYDFYLCFLVKGYIYPPKPYICF